MLVVGCVLVGLHWLVAVITFRSDRRGNLFRGAARTLVEDGEIDRSAVRKSHMSRADQRAALRSNASTDDIGEVKSVRMERSGDISVIEQAQPPRVLEAQVADGIQTVWIEPG